MPGKRSTDIPERCLAGVHWYDAVNDIVDKSRPKGMRGWNVEHIAYANDAAESAVALEYATTAQANGLVNIIRIDYSHPCPVPKFAPQPEPLPSPPPPDDNAESMRNVTKWIDDFYARVGEFVSAGVADIFIVGNEPTNEPPDVGVMAREYADRFNRLYGQKNSRSFPGIKLLAAGPGAFATNPGIADSTFLDWLQSMSEALTEVDGFALHSYGNPWHEEEGCDDPRKPCPRFPKHDGGFMAFRQQIDRIGMKWGTRNATKPVYITEFNTDDNGLEEYPNPSDNYKKNWVSKAFEAVRQYNATRFATQPPVMCLCWFVDRTGANLNSATIPDRTKWRTFALSDSSKATLVDARDDMSDEFHGVQTLQKVHTPDGDVYVFDYERSKNYLPVIPFACFAFEKQWARSDSYTDRHKANNEAQQSWIWGPGPMTLGKLENYASKDGMRQDRLVQYFEKARMEINDPAHPDDVTNGLLVFEMISGWIQTSDSGGNSKPAAQIKIAGDLVADSGAPTYAALGEAKIAYPADRTRNEDRRPASHPWHLVTEIIGPSGQRVTDAGKIDDVEALVAALGEKVGIADYKTYGTEPVAYNVPKVFSDFLAKTGNVYDYARGEFVEGTIMEGESAAGFPLMEPYWTCAREAGKDKWVFVQAFQRRLLTYTPSNSPVWQIQMGNVGSHYYNWRYDEDTVAAKVAGATSHSVPAAMQPAEQVEVEVKVSNHGTAAWLPTGAGSSAAASMSESKGAEAASTGDDVAKRSAATQRDVTKAGAQRTMAADAGIRLVLTGSSVPWGVGSIPLAHGVAQGAEAVFRFSIKAPSTPGHYSLELRLTDDRSTWRGARTTGLIDVNVGDAPGVSGPAGLTARLVDPTEILFSWNGLPWADKYSFEIARSPSDLMRKRGSDAGGTYLQWQTPGKDTLTRHTVQAGQTYWWRVFAYKGERTAYGYPEPPSIAVPHPPAYTGSLDRVDCAVVAGWAWDASRPDSPIFLDVHADGTRIATIAADRFRADLPGNGRHAFGYTPPERLFDGRPHAIKLVPAGASNPVLTHPQPLLGRLVTLSGRIVDESGSDVAGARVELLQGEDPVRSAVSGVYGFYRFTGVRSGEGLAYSLRAAKDWHVPVSPVLAFPSGPEGQPLMVDAYLEYGLWHRTHAIEGAVTTASSGSQVPVPGIGVRVVPEGAPSSAPTHFTGRFNDADRGRYRVQGLLAGRPYTVEPVDYYRRFEPPRIAVALLTQDRRLDFQAFSRLRKIAVTVLEKVSGSPARPPLSGVRVVLARKDGEAPAREGTTDAGGRCEFREVPTGHVYSVSASKDHFVFGTPYLETPVPTATPGDLADLSIDVVGERIQHLISGKVTTAALTLDGIVRDPACDLAGVKLEFTDNGIPGDDLYTVFDGTYGVRQQETYGCELKPTHEHFEFEPAMRQINYLLADLPHQDFVAKRKRWYVSGHVADSGGRWLRNATVQLVWKSSGPGIGYTVTTTTNSGGYYLFDGAYAGVHYAVRPVGATGFQAAPVDRYVWPVLAGHEMNMDFVAGHEVRGRLADIRGHAIPDVILTVREAGGQGTPIQVRTDADGGYRAMRLAPGYSYVVTPEKSGMSFEPASRSFRLSDETQTADFVGGHHVGGRIEDDFAIPRIGLAGVEVVIECSPPLPPACTERACSTDGLGQYRFATLFPPGTTCVVTPTATGAAFEPPSRSKVGLQYHQPFGFQGGHSIRGQVWPVSGKPMRGVDVRLERIAPDATVRQRTAATDDDGTYAFKSLAPGHYRVSVAADGDLFAPAVEEFAVPDGARTVDFRRTCVVVGGTVRRPAAGRAGQVTGFRVELSTALRSSAGAGPRMERPGRPLATTEATLTDRNGSYRFLVRVQDADYTVRVVSDSVRFTPERWSSAGLTEDQVVDFSPVMSAEPPGDGDPGPA